MNQLLAAGVTHNALYNENFNNGIMTGPRITVVVVDEGHFQRAFSMRTDIFLGTLFTRYRHYLVQV